MGEITINKEDYCELLAAKEWRATHEQELTDLRNYKMRHEQADPDEQVKEYLTMQAERDKVRAEKVSKLKSSML